MVDKKLGGGLVVVKVKLDAVAASTVKVITALDMLLFSTTLFAEVNVTAEPPQLPVIVTDCVPVSPDTEMVNCPD